MEIKKENVYYSFSIIFVICVVVSNVIAGRLVQIGAIQLPASILIFPITFIIGDLTTELFGFKKALNVTLIGFVANLFLVFITYIAISLPAPSYWELSEAYSLIFSFTPRVFVASFGAFLIGSISNSAIMVWLKRVTNRKFLWIRTISSTIVGEFLDSLVFCFISFIGNLNINEILLMVALQAGIKIAYEILFTPLVYLLVNKFKEVSSKGENSDG